MDVALDGLKKLVTVALFAMLCAGIFGFLWINSGGKVPVVSQRSYTVAVDLPKAGNVVYFSDVMVAGVKVGKVTEVEERGDHARVEMALDREVAPLHKGASVVTRAKSLVEESFLEVTDGDGAEIPSGSVLPEGAAKGPTQLDDVLQALDGPTRESVREVLRSLGEGTQGSKDGVASAAQGLALLGTDGRDVVETVAGQSKDIKALTRNAARLLAALSERRTAVSALVKDAQTLTAVTAGQQDDLRATMRALPPLLTTASDSSDDLERLGVALSPVARNLTTAAPHLTRALEELPGTAADLRATLPSLTAVLDKAPRTLTKVPTVAADIEGLLPPADQVLTDVNPMLGYLAPYDRELVAFFTNFAQALALGDRNGTVARLMLMVNEQSLRGLPLSTNLGPLDRYNPLPGAGSLVDPKPYGDETYPKVTRE